MAHPMQEKATGKVMTTADTINTDVRVVSASSANVMAEQLISAAQVQSQVGEVEVLSPIDLDVRGGPMSGQELNLEQVRQETGGQITSQSVPINQLGAADVDDILSDSIIAKPLALPNFLDVKAKDPKFRLRWVQFKAQGGARYEQLLAAGFRNALPQEIVGLNSTLLVHPDGIKYHDTILMIIEADKLLGQYKWNFMRSLNMTSRSGALQKAAEQASNQFTADSRSGEFAQFNRQPDAPMMDSRGHSKVAFYIPKE